MEQWKCGTKKNLPLFFFGMKKKKKIKPNMALSLRFLPGKMKPIFQHPNEYFKDECFLKLIGAHYRGIKSQMD